MKTIFIKGSYEKIENYFHYDKTPLPFVSFNLRSLID